ncbi:MAG: cysteine--tRNA ligase [bacterium]|nr:cysteine--tRNA ligase [bacterium]
MRIYNTVTKNIEEYQSIEPGRVRMYTCGPTVYSYQHIGNLRAYLFADLLKRALQFSGYRVLHAMNITDVGHLTDDADAGDDKVEMAARESGMDAWALTEKYKAKFMEDCAAVNVTPPDIVCRATDHIDEQIDLLKRLDERGHTYRAEDGLYFDAASFTPVTDLSNMAVTASDEHSRVGTEGKRSGADFALWKFSPPDRKRQMEWPSPWGAGFPGWHLECSAMSMKYLGETFDLHTGGVDHIPVHHPNEIIQSEAATGVRFVNYWAHGGWLSMGDSEKMSKSEGGTLLIDHLIERGYDPLAFRYLVLTAHYRSPLKFTWEALDAAASALRRVREEVACASSQAGSVSAPYMERFSAALSADLNTPEAVAVLWGLVKDSDVNPRDKAATILAMDTVLGLRVQTRPSLGVTDVPTEVLRLVQKRREAKAQREYAEADALRDRIGDLGFDVMDTPDGPALRSQ